MEIVWSRIRRRGRRQRTGYVQLTTCSSNLISPRLSSRKIVVKELPLSHMNAVDACWSSPPGVSQGNTYPAATRAPSYTDAMQR